MTKTEEKNYEYKVFFMGEWHYKYKNNPKKENNKIWEYLWGDEISYD